MDNERRKIKVTVILEHYEGDKNWSASVPLIEGCLAEGETPEKATEAIVPEIQYFLEEDSALIETLVGRPELLVTEVEVPLNEG